MAAPSVSRAIAQRRSSASISRSFIPPRIARRGCRRALWRPPPRKAGSRLKAGECAKTAPGFWANVVIDAIHDDSGALLGLARITRDMTDRRGGEGQLRQSQK